MAAALDVDKEAVRVLVVAVGCREAARQLGLPEDTVKSWSSRGGWLKGCKAVQQLPSSMRPAIRAPNAPTPASAMANSLSELGKSTRLNLARALSKGAEHVSTLSGPEILDKAEPIGQLTRSGVPVFGWKDGDDKAAPVTISIHLRGMELDELPAVSGRVNEQDGQ
jgi:hypothetical protein